MSSCTDVFTETIKKYEKLIKKERKRNKEILLNIGFLKKDNLFLRNHINILHKKIKKINSNIQSDQMNTNNDYWFIIYKINERVYYCVFGNRDSIKNKMEDMADRAVEFCDTDSFYKERVFQLLKEENKRELKILKKKIISVLKTKTKNFDDTCVRHKKVVSQIFNKNKGFEIIDNKIILNKTSIKDVVDSYGKIKKKMNEFYSFLNNGQ